MNELLPTDLTLRRFLGYFLPGFGWLTLVLLTVQLPEDAVVSVIAEWFRGNPLAWTAALSLLAFVFGSTVASLSLRLAALLGDTVDRITARLSRSKPVERVVETIADRLHILSPITIQQHTKALSASLTGTVPTLPELPNEHRSWWGRSYKLYVLEHSKELGREALDAEADINLFAGFWLPAVALGIWAYANHHAGLGLALVIVGVYLALRVQYLRHKEIQTIAASYMILRMDTRDSMGTGGGAQSGAGVG